MPPSSAPDRRAGTRRRASIRTFETASIAFAALAALLAGAAAKDLEKPASAAPPPRQSSPMPPAMNSAPLPPPRPDLTSDTKAAPLPPPRRDGASEQPKEPPTSGPNGAATQEAVVPPRGPSSDDPTPCLDRLAKLGVKMEPMAPIVAGACGAEHPFRMSKLPDGVAAAPTAEVGCPMAEALARWVLEVVEPEAQKHLNLAPKKVLIGTSYECRGQNRDAAAKLSEHAFANAVDVMGFAFEKGPNLSVTARGDDTPEGRFQAAVRTGACTYFNTVLGPGSDPSHSDHLHLDQRPRKAGQRICQ